MRKKTRTKRNRSTADNAFGTLVGLMERLRGPGGCAWDKRHNHHTLLKYLFEEAKEVSKAIRTKDMANLKEELGDLLLQVIFHAQLAGERGDFTIEDVIGTLNAKLRRRHPHVFTSNKTEDLDTILRNWKVIKQREKRQTSSKSAPTTNVGDA